MNFLKYTSEMSSLRVCMLILTLAVSFHICWATVAKLDIEWWEVSILIGVVLYGKIEQKKVEARQEREAAAAQRPIESVFD